MFSAPDTIDAPAPWQHSERWRTLRPVLAHPVHYSSAKYPYLSQVAWERLRDHVPHLFGAGAALLELLGALERAISDHPNPTARDQNTLHACAVITQIVNTAAITAPPDLWLLRQVLGSFWALGLSQRLLAGEALVPGHTQAAHEHEASLTLDVDQLETDLLFLLARGIVEQYDEGFRIAGHPRVRALLEAIKPLPAHLPSTATTAWRALLSDQELSAQQLEALLWLGYSCPVPTPLERHNHWVASQDEVEIGFRLVPLVLGLRATERTRGLTLGQIFEPHTLAARYPGCAAGALRILQAAGWLSPTDQGLALTALGLRGLTRGPGPFGIIETYHGYMANNVALLTNGRDQPGAQVWVSRSENVGASQDANRKTFRQANDSLDRFSKDTGFSASIFVEHAIGRGEATRQRFERSGEAMHYFGADLEDAAIDAAIAEQAKGQLPTQMRFVRHADIGKPQLLIQAIEAAKLSPQGAVMMVGNGFHEVRDQTDESMVEVFKGYHDAGILLLFTEENALSVDDLRATAWNTYHAGFKYVHEKSGQCLRPADPRPPVKLGRPLRAPWSECAQRAGYIRLDDYCTRTRTIYPYTPRHGFNPSISVNHFFIPADLAKELGLS